MEYKGLTIEFRGDTSKMSAALTAVNKDISKTHRELLNVERALKFNPGNTTLLSQQQDLLSKKIGSTTEKLKAFKDAESQLKSKGITSGDDWDKLQRNIIVTESKLKQYNKQLSESVINQAVMESSLGKAGTSIESFGTKISGAGTKIATTGRNLSLTLTPAIIAAGIASFNVAADFESAMSRVSGALNDPTVDIEELRQLALKTGQDTIFSATEAGAAMEQLAKGGLTAADIKGGALASTMNLAAAGGLSLDVAANTVVRSMGAFGLSADQVNEAVNALAGSAAASSADVAELSEGLSQVSAQANSAGWSVQDTTAVLGAFADAGVKGSDAGTSLKTMLQRLAAPTDEAADTISSLNIQARDSHGLMKDAAGVAQELSAKMGTLSSAEKDAAMQKIFGSDASRAALIMTGLGKEGIEKYTAATNDQTAAQRLADSQMGASEKALEQMKGALETAAIQAGTALAPAVIDAANAVGKAAESFGSLDEGTQKVIISAAILAAGLGPVLFIVGKGMEQVKDFGKALKSLAGFFAKVDAATGGATVATETNTSATKKNEQASKAHANTVKASSVAMGAAKAAAAGLALVLAGLAVQAIAEYVEKQSTLMNATKGLEAESRRASIAITASGKATQGTAVDTSNLAKEVDDLAKKQADLSKTMGDTTRKAATDTGMLESYQQTINELANQSDLSAEKQAELAIAVQGVNDATGLGLSVTNAATGEISNQNGEIQKNIDWINLQIDAKQRQIQLEAATSNWKAAYDAEQEASEKLAAANVAKQKAYEATNEARKNGITDISSYIQAETDANNVVKEAEVLHNADAIALENYKQKMNLLTQAQQQGTDSLAGILVAHGQMVDTVAASGNSIKTFQTDLTSALSNAGISVSDFGKYNADELNAIALGYDGTSGSIVTTLQTLGKVAPPEGAAASQATANAVKAPMTDLEMESQQWGTHIGDNIANGLGSSGVLGRVAASAANVASEIWARLHQTTAEIGPLKDTDKWGGHLVENIIDGMKAKESALGLQSARLASITSGSFSTGGRLNMLGSKLNNVLTINKSSSVDPSTLMIAEQLTALNSRIEKLDNGLGATIAENAPVVTQTNRQARRNVIEVMR